MEPVYRVCVLPAGISGHRSQGVSLPNSENLHRSYHDTHRAIHCARTSTEEVHQTCVITSTGIHNFKL